MRWQFVLLGLLAGLGLVGSLRAAEQSDGHERAIAEMLKLLEAGDYKAIAQADAMYTRWRDEYAGAEPPQMTASGKWSRSWDPKVRYLRAPPPAVNEGAKRMAVALEEIRDPKALDYLLGVRSPGLSNFAYAAALEIGAELCREGRLTEGLRAYHAAAVAWDGQKPDQGTRDWTYPRLADGRPRPQLEGVVQEAMADKDCRELIRAYQATASDDRQARDLSQILLYGATVITDRNRSGQRYLPLMAEALKDRRPEPRAMAAQLLHWSESRFKDRRAVCDLLLAHLDDADATARFYIANSLVGRGDGRGLKVLLAQPAPKNFSPHAYPVRAMGVFNMRQATPWIIELAKKEPATKDACIRALYLMADPRAIEFLGEILMDAKEPPLWRSLAASALGETMDDRAFPYLEKALVTADPDLSRSILTSSKGVHPELVMPRWIDSMQKLGLLDGGDLRKRSLGYAWLTLHYASGYPDVIGQYHKDKDKLLEGMREYWQGRLKLHELSLRVRRWRYAEPDAEKENAAWRDLGEAVRTVPARCFPNLYELGPPDDEKAVSYRSNDGKLLIRKIGVKGHVFVLEIVELAGAAGGN